MVIDERLLKHLRNWYKDEKSIGACVSDEEFAVNTLNLLLLHTEQTDILDAITGLYIVIERLGLEDYCKVVVERFCDGKFRALLYNVKPEDDSEEEPEC